MGWLTQCLCLFISVLSLGAMGVAILFRRGSLLVLAIAVLYGDRGCCFGLSSVYADLSSASLLMGSVERVVSLTLRTAGR